jgi:hypothetical protein
MYTWWHGRWVAGAGGVEDLHGVEDKNAGCVLILHTVRMFHGSQGA